MNNSLSIQKLDSNAVLSEVAVYNNTVYLAGQVPDDDSLDIVGQSKQVFDNIDKMLAKVGSDKSKMLSAQVFITDLANFEAFNQEWQAWLQGTVPPVRATVQAALVNPKWLVEITIVAAL